MNLHGLVTGVISAVTPTTPVTVMQSTGYTTSADGSQVPTYDSIPAEADFQALTFGDIQRLNGLNVQGVTTKAYLTGNFSAAFRKAGKGGDLVKTASDTYLVSAVLERWPDWVCVALTLQLDDN